ncbi:hypothetical protein M409DRAFT_29577 [Zasmidium cellare ATCC 36951]|uniref:Uncharacterized protein n=1 Tax=Zasmidium cellare ATCC 36951 TaxID=1080233 RepID=A0A6A6BYU4_ZASCE|nr:uncharacterized protein M409DRAFT_29577 [Zasmidium cellare ATCC 36951]KAF2159967.1 hypothetical protein M409DRAFT_29577 [Zasmidium cellare ATCC 36951]
MASDLNLTTSVTFQFVLAQSTYPNLTRSCNNTPNLRLIRQTLMLPMQARCSTCGKSHDFQLPLSDLSHGTDKSRWYVGADATIVPSLDEIDSLGGDQKYFHFHGIKVKSRTFDKAHMETNTDKDDVFHTHTIKKAPGMRSIAELLKGVKVARILDIDQVDSKGPLSFSQQASTFDSTAVMAWIDVLTKVVLRAHYAEGTFFAWQFSGDGEYRAPSYDAEQMLRDLHVKKRTMRYYRSSKKDDISQRDEDLAAALGSTLRGDLLGPLAMHVANTAIANTNHDRVKETIGQKLRAGGYGRYNASYIEAVGAASSNKPRSHGRRSSWVFI